MEAHCVQPTIQLGRRVHYEAGYGCIGGDGLIVAIHGNPNHAPPVRIGAMRVIRKDDCRVDVILFDGRRMLSIHQCSIDAPGIGIKLLDRVHGPELIEVAKRNAARYEADRVIAEAKAAEDFKRNEASRVIENPPLFYWNGIKDAKGQKLQPCWYSGGQPGDEITIYARDYTHFSPTVRACFRVENNSDLMTDYFEQDRIRVIPEHPLYAKVREALEAQNAHREKMGAKRRSAA